MRKYAIIVSCLCIGGTLLAGLVAQASPDAEKPHRSCRNATEGAAYK